MRILVQSRNDLSYKAKSISQTKEKVFLIQRILEKCNCKNFLHSYLGFSTFSPAPYTFITLGFANQSLH